MSVQQGQTEIPPKRIYTQKMEFRQQTTMAEFALRNWNKQCKNSVGAHVRVDTFFFKSGSALL